MPIAFDKFVLFITIFWIGASVLLWFRKSQAKNASIILSSLGAATLLVFIILLWNKLERPPMRTLGETRLWYSLFLSIIGIVIFAFKKYKWFLSYSLGLSLLFLAINYFRPDVFNKALMPALQSVWFIPHVIVYMVAYALLAASATVAIYHLVYKKAMNAEASYKLANDFIYSGTGFLTLGLLFGALWAKEAWGHYWTWDPKETWALLTWLCYIIYIHYISKKKAPAKTGFYILGISFIVLLVCWFGINYLPMAQNSVHVYSS